MLPVSRSFGELFFDQPAFEQLLRLRISLGEKRTNGAEAHTRGREITREFNQQFWRAQLKNQNWTSTSLGFFRRNL